ASPDPGQELQLAQLLDDLTEQLRQGRPPDVDAAARQHPDLADELRELWGAVLLADGLARSSPDPKATADLPKNHDTANSSPAPFPRTFGDYELREEVGRGAMGVVYKAYQHSLSRHVAVKMLLRGELASGADLARFRAEAESAARLQHPNVVPVY